MTTPSPIAPPYDHPTRLSRLSRLTSRIRAAWTSLVALWDSIQVELHGCYSVQRMEAFYQYAHKRTLVRGVLVMVATPLPCLAAVAFADCIPLEPPDKGIRHSGGFWIRATFATWVYTYSIMEQLRYFVPELPLTGYTTLALSIPVMVATNGVTFLLAWCIGFPLPFTIPMLSVPWSLLMLLGLWLILRHHFQERPCSRTQVGQFLLVAGCQMSLLLVYPTYNAIFYNMSSFAQTLFALLLPVIKLIEKNLVSFILRRMDDLKPELVIFNVEIFNALFIACCMQNANSMATNIVLVAVDFVSACVSLRDLDQLLLEVNRLAMKLSIDKKLILETALAISQQSPRLEHRVTIRTLEERTEKTRSRHSSRVTTRTQLVSARSSGSTKRLRKVFSCFFSRRTHPEPTQSLQSRKSHILTQDYSLEPQAITLPMIPDHGTDDYSRRASSNVASTTASLGMMTLRIPETIVAPTSKPQLQLSSGPAQLRRPASIAALMSDGEQLLFLQKTLQALHLTEYLLLVEYTEVMIPIVYSLYLIVLFHLPNRAYYPQLKHMDEQRLRQTIANVMVNATCEFISLVLLTYVLYRKRQPSPLRQLAFVLDRQWRMVQSKLVLWVVVTLQSTLDHLGK